MRPDNASWAVWLQPRGTQQQKAVDQTLCLLLLAFLLAVTLLGVLLGVTLTLHEVSWFLSGGGVAQVGGRTAAVACVLLALCLPCHHPKQHALCNPQLAGGVSGGTGRAGRSCS